MKRRGPKQVSESSHFSCFAPMRRLWITASSVLEQISKGFNEAVPVFKDSCERLNNLFRTDEKKQSTNGDLSFPSPFGGMGVQVVPHVMNHSFAWCDKSTREGSISAESVRGRKSPRPS